MLTDHPDEAAERNPVNGVYGAAGREANADQSWRESEAELLDGDAEPLGGEEVPHLVDEDEKPKHREDEKPLPEDQT